MPAKKTPGDPDTGRKSKKAKAGAPPEDVFDVNLYTQGVMDIAYDVLKVDKKREHGQVSIAPIYCCCCACNECNVYVISFSLSLWVSMCIIKKEHSVVCSFAVTGHNWFLLSYCTHMRTLCLCR